MHSRVRRALRSIRDQRAAQVAIGLAFYGHQRFCPCCGHTFRKFRGIHDIRVDAPDRICWACGSLERHRSVALYHPDITYPGMRILHVAPEASLRRRFQVLPGVHYVAGDLDTYFGAQRINVTDLSQFADGSFDAVVCNHVLEHVPDDRAAMREIRRVLADGGWGLLLVPDVRNAVTDEDPSITDVQERIRRFGQHDDVRNYGWDYVDRLTEAGFKVCVEEASLLFDESTIKRCRLKKLGELEPLFFVR